MPTIIGYECWKWIWNEDWTLNYLKNALKLCIKFGFLSEDFIVILIISSYVILYGFIIKIIIILHSLYNLFIYT